MQTFTLQRLQEEMFKPLLNKKIVKFDYHPEVEGKTILEIKAGTYSAFGEINDCYWLTLSDRKQLLWPTQEITVE